MTHDHTMPFNVYSYMHSEYVRVCQVKLKCEIFYVILNLRTVRLDFATSSLFDAVAYKIRDCSLSEFASLYPRARSWLTRTHAISFTTTLILADATLVKALYDYIVSDMTSAFIVVKRILQNRNTKMDECFAYAINNIYEYLVPKMEVEHRRRYAARVIFNRIKSALCNPYHPLGRSYQLREFDKLIKS